MRPLRGSARISYDKATPDHEGVGRVRKKAAQIMRHIVFSVFTAPSLREGGGEVSRNVFFDDPLFEEFPLRPLILDGCSLGSE